MKPTLTVSLEIKSLKDREFDGHGSVFKNVDLGGDIVMPGAFKRSLNQHKRDGSLPQMFWMHDPSRVPGKWLDMHEDDEGLAVRGVLAPTDLGNEIHTLLKMDAVRGLSIGYRTRDQDFDKDGNRLIKEADLWEVSVVSLPMNPLAQIAHVKSRLSVDGVYVPTPKEFETSFRQMGCSKQIARKLVSKIFDAPGETLGDEGDEAGATLADSSDSPRCDAEGDDEVLKTLVAIQETISAHRQLRRIS
jgi:uncharacterized protein